MARPRPGCPQPRSGGPSRSYSKSAWQCGPAKAAAAAQTPIGPMGPIVSESTLRVVTVSVTLTVSARLRAGDEYLEELEVTVVCQ